jgi:hypothetical protein
MTAYRIFLPDNDVCINTDFASDAASDNATLAWAAANLRSGEIAEIWADVRFLGCVRSLAPMADRARPAAQHAT